MPLKVWPNTALGCNHQSICMPQLHIILNHFQPGLSWPHSSWPHSHSSWPHSLALHPPRFHLRAFPHPILYFFSRHMAKVLQPVFIQNTTSEHPVAHWAVCNRLKMFIKKKNYKLIIIIIIWFGDTVTVSHLTMCNTNSKVRAMSA